MVKKLACHAMALTSYTDVYLEPRQTSTMEVFGEYS